MASGSEDYWMTKSRFVGTILDNIFTGLGTGSDLIDALDALDGTMDGKLTLSELNTSSVKTNLDTSNTKLQTSIDKLVLAITQLTGIHSDTTDMIDFATDSGNGYVYDDGWYLIASSNGRRISLAITASNPGTFSRNGTGSAGSFGSGTFYFYDSPGVWLKAASGVEVIWSSVEISAN